MNFYIADPNPTNRELFAELIWAKPPQLHRLIWICWNYESTS